MYMNYDGVEFVFANQSLFSYVLVNTCKYHDHDPPHSKM